MTQHILIIERKVPIPKSVKETLRSMKVGDSFVWDGARMTPYMAARKAGVRITMRKIKEGYRIWRVK